MLCLVVSPTHLQPAHPAQGVVDVSNSKSYHLPQLLPYYHVFIQPPLEVVYCAWTQRKPAAEGALVFSFRRRLSLLSIAVRFALLNSPDKSSRGAIKSGLKLRLSLPG